MGADPSAVIDPWQDPAAAARAGGQGQRETRVLSHRLSYDHASGVIVLPDEEWGEEGSESEEDYGTAGLEQSVTESMLDAEGAGGASTGAAGGSGGSGSVAAGSAAGGAGGGGPLGRLSRYGTYFHHPERRKQSVPGAFPGR